MSEFRIVGGRRLSGEVTVHGAKNSVLPILAATALVPGVSVIHNCPRLSDVTASLTILEHLGCRTAREGDTVTVDASALEGCGVPDALMREMRSSVIFLGAILARMGRADMSLPGGCELGPRPIDLHLAALRSLGAEISEGPGGLHCTAPRLTGREISLSLPSVGATENIMLCACGAQGTTVLVNAAREPEIADLQDFLNAMGARVRGAGSSTIVIEGGQPLHGGEHTVIGDRIVAATYLTAAAAAG
ncbi:MAG: UDP-N-acetylglucosamine 1-carboxyvinyltransferase, partial [Oscillospiraceae bacterium]